MRGWLVDGSGSECGGPNFFCLTDLACQGQADHAPAHDDDVVLVVTARDGAGGGRRGAVL